MLSIHNGTDPLDTVTVTDHLDPGVDFVEAGFIAADGSNIPNRLDGNTMVNYSRSHTVTWTLENLTGERAVYVTVKVNDEALHGYEYDDTGRIYDAGEIYSIEEDTKVVNMARVSVVNGGSQYEQYTNVLEHTVEPDKVPTGFPGYTGSDELSTAVTKVKLGGEWVDVTIAYNPRDHTITWELVNVPAFYSGKVSLSVVVMAAAAKTTR